MFNEGKYKEKVFRTIEKYRLIKNNDKIAVALSGGKDSSALLFLLKEYVENYVKADIFAFHINLNFSFSQKVEDVVKEICKIAKVDLIVENIEKYKIDIIKISKIKKRPVCSVCGLIKRYLINKIPKENKATKVATGHHMYDFLIFYFRNILTRNFEWNFKILPKLKAYTDKFVTKIRPLIFVKPEENKYFCEKNKIPFLTICPYSISSDYIGCYADKLSLNIYEMIRNEKIDWENFLKSIITFNKKYFSGYLKELEERIGKCEICNEPSNQKICGFCKLVLISNK
jgi:tRNA(Ile)-lysidine synthase TilS/MesJ